VAVVVAVAVAVVAAVALVQAPVVVVVVARAVDCPRRLPLQVSSKRKNQGLPGIAIKVS